MIFIGISHHRVVLASTAGISTALERIDTSTHRVLGGSQADVDGNALGSTRIRMGVTTKAAIQYVVPGNNREVFVVAAYGKILEID